MPKFYLASLVAAALSFLSTASAMAQTEKIPPRPTPPVFATPVFGLTFRTPPGSSYCALSDPPQGSDHGVVVFLKPPAFCAGRGYPSSSRGFFPSHTPLIQVYYQYWMGDDEPPSEPCASIGKIRFLGRAHRLCRVLSTESVNVWIQGRYRADQEAEALFTLTTTPDRFQRDLATFKTLIKTTRACSAQWGGNGKAPSFVIGTGRPCPDGDLDF